MNENKQNPNDAVQNLIRLGLQVKGVLLSENNSVAKQDHQQFEEALNNKEKILAEYERAVAEFGANLAHYRTADQELLEQLKTLQDELVELSKKSMDLLKVIADKAN